MHPTFPSVSADWNKQSDSYVCLYQQQNKRALSQFRRNSSVQHRTRIFFFYIKISLLSQSTNLVTSWVYMIHTHMWNKTTQKIEGSIKWSGFGECTERGIQRLPIIISGENAVSQRTFQKNEPQQPVCHFLVHLHSHMHISQWNYVSKIQKISFTYTTNSPPLWT